MSTRYPHGQQPPHPQYPQYAPQPLPPQQGSSALKIVLWVLGSIFLVFLLLCGGGAALVYFAVQRATNPSLPYEKGDDLEAETKAFRTRLTRTGPSPQSYENESPPYYVRQVEYPSSGMMLKAWLSKPPTDGKQYPAVVFLHGGWAFAEQDWRDANVFQTSGFVLMTPMLRAENGNPGNFECNLGEVDDAIAAGRYMAALSYVDSNNVFVAGHSAGGTLAVLVAQRPGPFKAAASFSGTVNYEPFILSRQWRSKMPFDVHDPEERRIRNPSAFIASLQCPLYLFVEDAHDMRSQNARFAAEANELGKLCLLRVMPGDHWTMVAPSILQASRNFKKMSRQ